jgi:hypothetical protein
MILPEEYILIDHLLFEFTRQFPISNLLKHLEKFIGGWNIEYVFNKSIYNAHLEDLRSGSFNNLNHLLVIRISNDRIRKPPEFQKDYLSELKTVVQIQRECKASFIKISTERNLELKFTNTDKTITLLKIIIERKPPREVFRKEHFVDLRK